LREQTVTPRAGRGGGNKASAADKGRAAVNVIVQQPAPRRGAPAGGKGAAAKQGGARSRRGAWHTASAWMPAAGKVLLAVCAALVLFRGYRAAASSEFFGLRSVDVSGAARASDDQIKQIVRRSAARGVWQADLGAIAAEIERQPWVRSAVVSRVLPSGLRVRVAERVPRAVVRTNSGRFVWVDDDAVMVGSLAPDHPQPAFFMRGWDESGADEARARNRERVEKFLSLAREWEAAGLSARVSEVNLDDLRDVRAQLAGDDSQIEVRLGRDDWTKRLVQAVTALDGQRETPRGQQITYIDMTQSKRAVLGYKSGASRAGDSSDVAPADAPEAGSAPTVNAVAPAPAAIERGRKPVEKLPPPAERKKQQKQKQKSPAAEGRTDRTADGAADGNERPRRATGEGVPN